MSTKSSVSKLKIFLISLAAMGLTFCLVAICLVYSFIPKESDVSALIQESMAEQNHFQSQMNEVSALSSNPAATLVDKEKEKQISKIFSDHDRNSAVLDLKLTLLAQLHPGSAAASKALCHLITQCGFRPAGKAAIKTIATDYAAKNEPAFADLCSQPFLEGPDFEAMLTELKVRSPNERTRALATIRLAQLTQASDKTKATALFKEATKKFGTLPFDPGGSRTVAQEARANLFEMEHLALGMVAPNISGQDAFGKAMKLSDYSGKVVLLDFFGNW